MLGPTAYHKTFLSCFPVLYVLFCQALSPRKVPCVFARRPSPFPPAVAWNQLTLQRSGRPGVWWERHTNSGLTTLYKTHCQCQSLLSVPWTFIMNGFFFFFFTHVCLFLEKRCQFDLNRRSPRVGSPANVLRYITLFIQSYFEVFRSANNLFSWFLNALFLLIMLAKAHLDLNFKY